ncbi:MAG: ABC transporter substrate-binding protein [Thermodesulfobacteriota bacterium]
MTRLLTIFLVMLTVICVLCIGTRQGYAGDVRGVSDDTIKIGLIGDQTGVAAPVGIPYTKATKTLFQNINDKGGINGRKIKLIVEDDHYTIPGAIAGFKKLIFRDAVLSLLFIGGTGQAFALLSQIEKHKVPVIPVSLADGLVSPVRKYVFTPTASYDDTIKLCVDYIVKDLKAKNPSIAFVYADNEFGKNGLRATEEYLTNYNLKLSSKAVINFTEIDATPQVLTLKKSDPDYIILHNAVGAVLCFFQAAKRYSLRSKVFGTFYVSDEENIKVVGDAMKDALATSPIGYWSDNTPGMAQLRKITTKYHPGTKWMIRSYSQGWLTALICAEGLKRAGKNLSPDTLVEGYETFKNFSTGEISAPISYSKNNHKGGTMSKLYKVDVKNQTFIPITDFREPAFKD